MEPWSTEWKQQRFEEIYTKWENCQGCQLSQYRKKVVLGDGDIDADIMFIGEAPGKEEDKEGKCFIGDSGGLLRGLCAQIGIRWEDIFRTNIVGCRPPKNRDPIAAEKDACLSRVHELIYLVDPLLVVTVGKYALNALTGGRSWGIENEHGKLFSSPDPQVRVPGERNGVVVPGKVFPRKGKEKKVYTLEYDLVPIFHPAHILRVDSHDKETLEFSPGGVAHQTLDDLQAVVNRVEQLKSEYKAIPKMIERM